MTETLLSPVAKTAAALLVVMAAWSGGVAGALAADQSPGIPAWLDAHVGEDEGDIARVVLQRARALYVRKVTEGTIRNPCYFAMDATRPNSLRDGGLGRRFYVICEAGRTFQAISAGHGGGRDLKGVVDFRNGRRCARHFGNALNSQLTAGGAYVTSEIIGSFKGYYRTPVGETAVLVRPFVQFDGEGDTANAREREIGGHPAVLLTEVCLRNDPANPYANGDGYVPFGKLVDYSSGRSSGCTSWSPSDAERIVAMVKDDPTTLYIYPEASDITAIGQALADRRPLKQRGLYWNGACLAEIGAPKYWPRQTTEPIIAQYQRDHPAPPPRPIPICKSP